ncbi:MAG: hypothetical protein N2110_03095 [Flavobacteriales bacterium]|nr:hypothetical protein [Flavobacteriales bacterium]MCX7767993.1 hypothetical protein [Flavobacteriales bacterium]MDW8409198.1 hypothetical protein [Flavobacteriales bacterium]
MRHTLADVEGLLLRAFPHARFLNQGPADVTFLLLLSPDTAVPLQKKRRYPIVPYPAHYYFYQGDQGFYVISSPSAQGLQFGLYGFLQDELGFCFYHPRESFIPFYGSHWPLKRPVAGTATPVFHKKGFHLHTTHPLELTEAFHNTGFSGGLQEIKEFINWLCRNGQNYFDFTLMRSVDLETWAPYAAEFVRYAHERGILVGLELSLHMVQQQVFQLVKMPWQLPLPFKTQIHRNLRQLFQAPWDFLNLDLTTAEFFGGMERLKKRLKYHLVRSIKNRYGAHTLLRKHVVHEEKHVGKVSGIFHTERPEDFEIGILLHTVMCYALTDSLAPVYENQNFHHVLRDLIVENTRRETWFYPESAYWITFDNSVPMLLLPYLSARYRDIRTCDSLEIPNHVTFSSGWEWGYWLVDWSIARWSWRYNNHLRPIREPLERLFGPAAASTLMQIMDIQEKDMKGLNLLRYLCPQQTIDELPRFLRKTFQPTPEWEPRQLAKAGPQIRHRVLEFTIPALNGLAEKMENLLFPLDTTGQPLLAELKDGLLITALRARHRALTICALLHRLKDKVTMHACLQKAKAIRSEALAIVRRMEKRYRYPLWDIALLHPSPTAYPYGYLWPVHNLHFWVREEEQARQGRFGPYFMNIWPLARIVGLD